LPPQFYKKKKKTQKKQKQKHTHKKNFKYLLGLSPIKVIP